MTYLRPDRDFSQNLANGALSFTTSVGRESRLTHAYVKASEPITETITITLISALGSDYDIEIAKRTLTAGRNFSLRPDEQIDLQAGDEIKVECTNANVTGTVKGAVKMSELYNRGG